MVLRLKGNGRRASISIVLVAVLATLLVPCTLFAGGSREAAGPAREITLWVNSASAQPLRDLWTRFEAETGIKVDIVSFPSDGFETALMQRWATGDRPDVMEWHANYNWLVAINPPDNLHAIDGQPFARRQLDGISASLNGVTYGMVLNTPTAWGIYYNKQVFDRLGLRPPTTAAELERVSKAIRAADASIVPLHESGGSMWPPLVMHGQFAADALEAGFLDRLVNRRARVNDADSPWLRSLQFYKNLQEQGLLNRDIVTAQFENSPSLLMEGRVAMVSLHSGFVQLAVDEYGLERVNETIGFTEWSETRPVVTVEYSPNGTYFLPKTGNAAREEAARKFMEFITGAAYGDYVKEAGIIPTLAGFEIPASIPGPMVEIQNAILQHGSTVPIWSLLPGITDLVTYPGQLIAGDLTPQSAVDLLQRQAEQGAVAAGLPSWP